MTVTANTPARGRVRGLALTGALVLLALALTVPAAAEAKGCSNQNANPGSISTAKAERAVFCLLNRERKRRGVPKLDRHKQLDNPSVKHSKLMVRDKCFEHECPGEPDLGDRLSKYLSNGGRGYGENIAWGSGSFGAPGSIVDSWMKSEGHRRNILDPSFEHIGIGIVWGSPSPGVRDAGTYTTDFGWRD